MAVTFVQATSGTNATGSTSTTATAAFTNPTVSGNAILVAIANEGAPNSVTSIVDTFNNTYKKIVSSGSSVTAEIWAAFNIAGGSSNIVTANQGFNDGAIFAHEYSGISPAPQAVDNYLGATQSTGASMSVGPTPPLRTLDEVVFVTGEMDIVGANSLSVGPGFGNFTTASSSFIRGAVESLVVTADTAQTATMVMNTQGGASWRIAVACFMGTHVGIAGNQFVSPIKTFDGISTSEKAN